MNVLGIHTGHDSSAALIVDGRIVADVAEERFSRIKHDAGLPLRSIDYCLKSQRLTMAHIDAIAVPASSSVPSLNHVFELNGTRREPLPARQAFVETLREWLHKPGLKPPLYFKNFPAKDSTPIVHVNHHLAHAASAYYTSGFAEKQLIVTIDGIGDNISCAIWRGDQGKIGLLKSWGREASLGWFYSNVTEALGWWHGDGEGKTMGLAPYGDFTKCRGALDKFYPKFSGGELVEPHEFGRNFSWHERGAIQWHFDEAYEIHDLVAKHGREHIAAEGQRVLEEQVKALVLQIGGAP